MQSDFAETSSCRHPRKTLRLMHEVQMDVEKEGVSCEDFLGNEKIEVKVRVTNNEIFF